MAVAIGAEPEPRSRRTEDLASRGFQMVPSAPRFQVVVSQTDSAVMISPHGDIDASTSPTLALALSSQLGEGRRSIVLDLAGVAALALDRAWVIGEASRLLTQREGHLAVVGANPAIREVLQAADLGWLLVDPERRSVDRGDDEARTGAD